MRCWRRVVAGRVSGSSAWRRDAYHGGVLKRFMNFLFESFGISAVGETPEERKWREFREQQGRRGAGTEAGGAGVKGSAGSGAASGASGPAAGGSDRGSHERGT